MQLDFRSNFFVPIRSWTSLQSTFVWLAQHPSAEWETSALHKLPLPFNKSDTPPQRRCGSSLGQPEQNSLRGKNAGTRLTLHHKNHLLKSSCTSHRLMTSLHHFRKLLFFQMPWLGLHKFHDAHCTMIMPQCHSGEQVSWPLHQDFVTLVPYGSIHQISMEYLKLSEIHWSHCSPYHFTREATLTCWNQGTSAIL